MDRAPEDSFLQVREVKARPRHSLFSKGTSAKEEQDRRPKPETFAKVNRLESTYGEIEDGLAGSPGATTDEPAKDGTRNQKGEDLGRVQRGNVQKQKKTPKGKGKELLRRIHNKSMHPQRKKRTDGLKVNKLKKKGGGSD